MTAIIGIGWNEFDLDDGGVTPPSDDLIISINRKQNDPQPGGEDKGDND
jgi:hypothetical protein